MHYDIFLSEVTGVFNEKRIAYQNTTFRTDQIRIPQEHEKTDAGPKRLRRSYIPQDHDIEPYMKKPRITSFVFQNREANIPREWESFVKTDLIWSFSCTFLSNCPMWVGWNSLFVEDLLPVQIVGYMETINLPPTRNDVVQETMKRTQAVAKECGQDQIIVTYDLAIAKIASQIQYSESPRFDNIFVCFRAFHISMAYFAVLGYVIENSGGDSILVDSDVLGGGSMNSFLAGKHNRCKRIHPMLALAFRILHIRQFLETSNHSTDELEKKLQDVLNKPGASRKILLAEMVESSPIIQDYLDFEQSTRNGNHGSTAAFWMMYIDLVDLYLMFSRASRTNNLQVFIYSLRQMIPLFFFWVTPKLC